MRWTAFAITAAACVAIQSTLAPGVEIFGARPDCMLILVVFFALYAAPREAYLSGWILGLLVDLTSIERFGLMSIAFCTGAILVQSIREMVFLRNFVTHFVVTFAAGALIFTGLSTYRLLMYAPTLSDWNEFLGQGFAVALYSAICAPPIMFVLLKISPIFDLHLAQSRYTRLSATRNDRV